MQSHKMTNGNSYWYIKVGYSNSLLPYARVFGADVIDYACALWIGYGDTAIVNNSRTTSTRDLEALFDASQANGVDGKLKHGSKLLPVKLIAAFDRDRLLPTASVTHGQGWRVDPNTTSRLVSARPIGL